MDSPFYSPLSSPRPLWERTPDNKRAGTPNGAEDNGGLLGLGCLFGMIAPNGAALEFQRDQMLEVKHYAKAQARELEACKSGAANASAELDQVAIDLQTAMSVVFGVSQDMGISVTDSDSDLLNALDTLAARNKGPANGGVRHSNLIRQRMPPDLLHQSKLLKDGMRHLTQSVQLVAGHLATTTQLPANHEHHQEHTSSANEPNGTWDGADEASLGRVSLEEHVKGLEQAKKAAEERAADAEDAVNAAAEVSSELRESEERKEAVAALKRIEQQHQEGKGGRGSVADDVAKVRGWVSLLEDRCADGEVMQSRMQREVEKLEAQTEQLEENLKTLATDRMDRITELREELELVCTWANEVEQEYHGLQEDYLYIQGLVPEEQFLQASMHHPDEQVGNLLAGALPSVESGPPQDHGSHANQQQQPKRPEIPRIPLTSVTGSSDGGGGSGSTAVSPSKLPPKSPRAVTPTLRCPEMPQLPSGSAASASEAGRPSSSAAAAAAGLPPTPLRRTNSRTNMNSTGSIKPEDVAHRRATVMSLSSASAPNTPRKRLDQGEDGKMMSATMGRLPRAPRLSLESLREEVSATIQKKARETLTERLEATIERLSRTEDALAKKDEEITQLKAAMGN